MKKILSLFLCFALCVPLFFLTSCGEGNTLTVRLSGGVTATLQERPIPFVDTDPSLWYEESLFEQEKREKNPRDSVYLGEIDGELFAYLTRPSELGILMSYHGYFVGHSVGEWGGNVVFYHYNQGGVATEVSADSLVAFAPDRDAYLFDKGYLLTEHVIYLLEVERTKESEGPVWTPIVHMEEPMDRITSGAMWDGLLYYTTNQGLFCYVDGSSFSLSALPNGFWSYSDAYGMTVLEDKIYLSTAFGIYEYDLETGQERLYTLLCKEFAQEKKE